MLTYQKTWDVINYFFEQCLVFWNKYNYINLKDNNIIDMQQLDIYPFAAHGDRLDIHKINNFNKGIV